MTLDVDKCLETLKNGECVSEQELRQLCLYVSELLMEESNVQPVISPVTVVGDLHGQFFDLLNMFKLGGWPPDTSYVFLGDFVDRGHNSVETLSLLLCLKLKYPGHITLLRGNHEVRFWCICLYVYGWMDRSMAALWYFLTRFKCSRVKSRKCMDFTTNVFESMEMPVYGGIVFNVSIASVWRHLLMNKSCAFMEDSAPTSVR